MLQSIGEFEQFRILHGQRVTICLQRVMVNLLVDFNIHNALCVN